jgi:hypothetical protein
MCASETSSCRLLLLFLALRDVVRVGEGEDEDVGDGCERAAVRKEERRRKRRVTEVKTARIGRYLVGGS